MASSLSRFKDEYLNISVSALMSDGQVQETSLAQLGENGHLLLLFHSAAFDPAAARIIDDVAIRLNNQRVQLVCVSTDSAEVHAFWRMSSLSSNSSEEDKSSLLSVDSLGKLVMLGDKNQRLCRSMLTLDENKGQANESAILLDKKGDVLLIAEAPIRAESLVKQVNDVVPDLPVADEVIIVDQVDKGEHENKEEMDTTDNSDVHEVANNVAEDDQGPDKDSKMDWHDVVLSALMPDLSVNIMRLSEFRGKKLLIVGFPEDFEEDSKLSLIKLSKQRQIIEELGCDLLFVSSYSVTDHQSWLESWSPDERPLGVPMIGDKANYLANCFGVLDETTSLYLPCMILLSEQGEVFEKLTESDVLSLDLNKAVSILENFTPKPEILEAHTASNSISVNADKDSDLRYVLLPALMPDLSINTVRLSEFRGKKLLIIGFPNDFEEEAKLCLVKLSEQSHNIIEQLGCALVFVSAYSVNGHLNWLESWSAEERPLSAPLLGDTAAHLARSFGVLDENTSVYLPSMLFLDEQGQLCHKIVERDVQSLDLNKAVPKLENLHLTRVPSDNKEEQKEEPNSKLDMHSLMQKELRAIRPGSFSSDTLTMRQLLLWGDARVTAVVFVANAFDSQTTGMVDAFCQAKDSFDEHLCKVVLCSTDSVQTQLAWLRGDVDLNVSEVSNLSSMPYVMVSDPTGELTAVLDMFDEENNVAMDGVVVMDNQSGRVIVKMRSNKGPNVDPEEILHLLPTRKELTESSIVEGTVANSIEDTDGTSNVEVKEEVAKSTEVNGDETSNEVVETTNNDEFDGKIKDQTITTTKDNTDATDTLTNNSDQMSSAAMDETDPGIPFRGFHTNLSMVVEEPSEDLENKKKNNDDNRYYVDNDEETRPMQEVAVMVATRPENEDKEQDENEAKASDDESRMADANEGNANVDESNESNTKASHVVEVNNENDTNNAEEANNANEANNVEENNDNNETRVQNGRRGAPTTVDTRFDPSISVNYGRVVRPNEAMASPREKSCCILM